MDRDFERFLKAIVKARRYHAVPCELKWCCLEELVLAVGIEYKCQPRPKRFEAGTPKLCFANSAMLAMEDDNLIYVEGYGFMRGVGISVHHAWVVERGSDKAIDVTTDNIAFYHGIPFRTEVLRKEWDRHPDGASMLDNWQEDYPLLRLEEAEIRALMPCP